jgi:hypothetical protein
VGLIVFRLLLEKTQSASSPVEHVQGFLSLGT